MEKNRRLLLKAKGFDRKVYRSEIGQLRKELKERLRKQTEEVLSNSQVVLATTTGIQVPSQNDLGLKRAES